MKIALLRCCATPIILQQYESSVDAVLGKLNIELVDIKEFNCCGYPLRNIDFKAFVLCSARNLAIAEKEDLNIVTICNCCYGSLKKADHLMKQNGPLREEMNTILKKEGLKYKGGIEVKHLLSVLYNDVGIDAIKEMIEKPFDGLKIATHYGCRILRPSKIVQFDDPMSPSIFDQLVEVTGAESINWSTKLECCGAPSLGINDDLSMDLTKNKLTDAKSSGANYLCVACPFCHIQFDRVQKLIISSGSMEYQLSCILYPQLLGRSLGIDREALGLEKNQLPLNSIEKFVKVQRSTISSQPSA